MSTTSTPKDQIPSTPTTPLLVAHAQNSSSRLTLRIQHLATGHLNDVVVTSNGPITCQDLKLQIAASLSIPVASQRLFFTGHELHDSTVLQTMGIVDHMCIQLAIRPSHVQVSVDPNWGAPTIIVSQPATHSRSRPVLPSITVEQAETLLEVHKFARIVKLLAILDLGGILCIFGYLGASHYSFGFTSFYLLYQLGQFGLRVAWLVQTDKDHGIWVLTLCALFVELWLASMTIRLLRGLASLSEEDKACMEVLLYSDYGFWTSPTMVRVVETSVPAHPYYFSQPQYQQPQFQVAQQASAQTGSEALNV